MAVIRGAQTTENIPSARKVRDVDPRLHFLDANLNPLTLITMRARSKVATNIKVEWSEKALPPKWDAVNNGAGYASGATSIVVDNASIFKVGDIVNVPRTLEKFRVTAVNTGTNTLTIVRGVGTTSAAALLDNDDLQIIGSAYAQGSGGATAIAVQETYPFNYTQIFKNSAEATGTEEASEMYNTDRDELRLDAWRSHKLDLERSLLFGERQLDTSDPNAPIGYTGGLLGQYLTSNVQDFGGILTESEVESWLQNVFSHTSGTDTRLLAASPTWVTVLDLIASGRQQLVPKATTYGVTINQWVTSHGTLMIVKHRLLENSPTPAGVAGGPFGYAGFALALEMERITYRPLRGRQTKLYTDIQLPDTDGWKDQYLTECGWQVENPELHGVGKNVTG